MSSLEPRIDHFSPETRGYLVHCHACSQPFDALTAEWCLCIVKERSLECPACRECFCRADVDYKRRFWTEAPETLWDRKQRQARERWSLPPNAAPEAVRRPLVLVVDDDREVRAMALQLIESWGFGCIHAADGANALELARSYKPDVVLTDALMPKMDGRELCRLIKSSPELAGTKVIIMSSVYTAGRFKREALSQFKADEFVSKPIDAKRLYRLVYGADSTPATPHLSVLPEDSEPIAVAPAIAELVPPVDAVEELEDDIQRQTVVAQPLPAMPLSLSATQLIYLRALGLDGEIAALARQFPRFPARDLITLRSAGIPQDFIRMLADTDVAPHEIVALFSTGCDLEAIAELREMHFTARDIISVMASEVPLSFVREIASIGIARFSATEILRMHAAGVELAFMHALHAHGYASATVDEWIGLWAAGVPAEFIESISCVLTERCSASELLRLWLTGVDASFLGEISTSV